MSLVRLLKLLTYALVFTLVGGASVAWAAQAGDPDSNFATNGVALTSAGSSNGAGLTAATLEEGKLLVAGTGTDGGGNPVGEVVRYNANGQPDGSFGTHGVVQLPSFSGDTLSPTGIAVAPGGGIIVSGTASSGGSPFGFGVVKLSSSTGRVDSGFAGGSKLATQTIGDAGSASANALAVDPTSGVIYVGGVATAGGPQEFTLAAFSSDGTVDHSFNSTGQAMVAAASDAGIEALALDGHNVIAAGYSGADAAVSRFTSTGPDSGFNSGQILAVPLGQGSGSTANAVVVEPNQAIVLGGSGPTQKLGTCMIVARLHSDGSFDTSFGSGGSTAVCDKSVSEIDSLARDSDGHLYAAGFADDSVTHTALLRLTSAGSRDSQFGSDGVVNSDPKGSSHDSEGKAVLVQGMNPVVAGDATIGNTAYFAVQRFLWAVPPENLGVPTVDGPSHPRVGDTFTGHPGSWSGTEPITYSYGWLRCAPDDQLINDCTGITTSSSGTYTIQPADYGHRLLLAITASNSVGARVAFAKYFTGVIDNKAATIQHEIATANNTSSEIPGTLPANKLAGNNSSINIDVKDPSTVVLIGDDSGSLISHDGGSLVAQLISDKGLGFQWLSKFITAGGGNFITAGGGNFITAGGGNFITAGGGNAADVPSSNSMSHSVLERATRHKTKQVALFAGMRKFKHAGQAQIALRPTKAGRKLIAAYQRSARRAKKHHRKVKPLRIGMITLIAPLKGKGPIALKVRVIKIRP